MEFTRQAVNFSIELHACGNLDVDINYHKH